MKMLAAVLAVLWSGTAAAQDFAIQIDPAAAGRLGIDAGAAEDGLSASISTDLNIVDQAAFLGAMADAAALVTRGMGVDYASNPKRFVLGASLGSAVNSAGAHFSRQGRELPEAGFSMQLSGMAGVNLGIGNEDSPMQRVMLYANGLALRSDGDTFSSSQYNLGGHVQVRLVDTVTSAAMEWGGVALTSGYELSTYVLGLEAGVPVTTQEGSAELTWDATGAYEVVASTSSVPLELSTNLRLLALTVYGGGGVDFIQGDATSRISLAGPITGKLGSQEEALGDASVGLNDIGLPDRVVPRFFVGTQVNLLVLKAYGQLNIGMNQSFGGHIGARIAL